MVHIRVFMFSLFKIKLYIQYIHYLNNTISQIINLYLALCYQLKRIFQYIKKNLYFEISIVFEEYPNTIHLVKID